MRERSTKADSRRAAGDRRTWASIEADLVAYAVRFGVPEQEFTEAAKRYRYSPTVFVCAPWKEIFVNDNERRISYEASIEFHDSIVEAYSALGCTLVEVPRGTPLSRAAFIAEHVLLCPK